MITAHGKKKCCDFSYTSHFKISSTIDVKLNSNIHAVYTNSSNELNKNRILLIATLLFTDMRNLTALLKMRLIKFTAAVWIAWVKEHSDFPCSLCCNFLSTDAMKLNLNTHESKQIQAINVVKIARSQ